MDDAPILDYHFFCGQVESVLGGLSFLTKCPSFLPSTLVPFYDQIEYLLVYRTLLGEQEQRAVGL